MSCLGGMVYSTSIAILLNPFIDQIFQDNSDDCFNNSMSSMTDTTMSVTSVAAAAVMGPPDPELVRKPRL